MQAKGVDVIVGDESDLLELFARRFPQEWQRTQLIPGLRQRVVATLSSPADTVERTIEATGYLLGYGRAMTDVQWQAWASQAFALAVGEQPAA